MVAHLDLERPEPGSDLLLKITGHAERVVPPDDGYDDIVLIENVVLEHGMNDIRGTSFASLAKKRAVPLILFTAL